MYKLYMFLARITIKTTGKVTGRSWVKIKRKLKARLRATIEIMDVITLKDFDSGERLWSVA